MTLDFIGNTPRSFISHMGITGNHKTDAITMRIPRHQDVDLGGYEAKLKVLKKRAVADIVAFDAREDTEDTVLLTWTPTAAITALKTVDLQLIFEAYDEEAEETYFWQTKTFSVIFDGWLDISEALEEKYPDVLEDIENRLNKAEEISESVLQFGSAAEFPNVGNESILYIDRSTNKCYRYDADEGNYHVVGSDYEDIKTINCNP